MGTSPVHLVQIAGEAAFGPEAAREGLAGWDRLENEAHLDLSIEVEAAVAAIPLEGDRTEGTETQFAEAVVREEELRPRRERAPLFVVQTIGHGGNGVGDVIAPRGAGIELAGDLHSIGE